MQVEYLFALTLNTTEIGYGVVLLLTWPIVNVGMPIHLRLAKQKERNDSQKVSFREAQCDISTKLLQEAHSCEYQLAEKPQVFELSNAVARSCPKMYNNWGQKCSHFHVC
ncbi:uncharacterized protein PHALS_12689 [Plasmopara halstedii]|uniref:Uncharacterized protein n=1 Tax=Plasmopara halstedii TaxID=4781 RepID=A0A0N7L5U0_PLAHL|nr:uncharacterized protein PHALS_12689 [Plasmopara halstedii]CEG42411.1 hypothetical protein PHALS_12689 [Plasmopara halstedii]|eukprot:XP_024578780.1 hypothetical protein PHALS_12689 [Plasmopara halstedii]